MLPSLLLSYSNNIKINASQNITFGNLSQMIITCQSVNSKPRVNLSIYNTNTNKTLPLVTGTQTSPNPLVFCFGDICSASVKAILTPGYATLYNISSLSCSADNFTYPYNMHTAVSFGLAFNCNINNIALQLS